MHWAKGYASIEAPLRPAWMRCESAASTADIHVSLPLALGPGGKEFYLDKEQTICLILIIINDFG
jgi:hypothetical protein